MAGSPEAERSSEAIAAALDALGLEVAFQPFEFVGYETDEPVLEVAGDRFAAAPIPYSPATDAHGSLRAIGFRDREEQDAPVFAIDDGNELARLYAAPGKGGAVPIMPVHGPTLGGPAAGISAIDGQRLLGMEGAEVRLRTYGRLLPNLRDRNVVGRLAGELDEWVVVSCHFDSVWHSPGVLDNATGVEGMFQVIERFLERPRRRGLLACAFAGEEIGLLGSRYFVTEAKIRGTIASIVGLVNLDAIARGEYLELSVAPQELEDRLLSSVVELGLQERYSIAWRDPLPDADDHPFAEQGIPTVSIVHFPYAEYHSTNESAVLVDSTRMRDAVDLAVRMIETQLESPVPCTAHPVVKRKMELT